MTFSLSHFMLMLVLILTWCFDIKKGIHLVQKKIHMQRRNIVLIIPLIISNLRAKVDLRCCQIEISSIFNLRI